MSGSPEAIHSFMDAIAERARPGLDADLGSLRAAKARAM